MFWRRGENAPSIGEVASAEGKTSEADTSTPSEPVTVELSVIDFGNEVVEGNSVLKGFCASGAPSEIRACVWKVDTAEEAKKGEKQPNRIHIEF
mmetsp:Transcript_8246/g.19779  ORF Transcript_8246/g.19779 Transcript_8246/m.19779 type:complete len:94 (-) Transcript_8246:456-737(-)